MKKISPGTRESDSTSIKGDYGSASCYSISITDNYSGLAEDRPESFKITTNNGNIISATGIPDGWARTPSKFPPGSSEIKWTNNSGDIPNGVTDLGNICFGNVTTDPFYITYEWLNKNGNVICSGIIGSKDQL